MSNWFAYDDGRSVGQVSAEGGVILRDDEHKLGARITLKRGSGYVSISCHIYGRTEHTRFFGAVSDADREFAPTRTALGNVINVIAKAGPQDIKIWEAISEFVGRFP